ncbi:MAG TPA: right-handed parallel beta-helix repeat-containing protein, partial [Bacteroidota bacterium]|nr:right-handed parallel beta-helix repeat-containing protein [Bacteroidota bacterium]
HARWAHEHDVWLQGFFNYGFADDRILVASIDTAAHEVKLATPHIYGLASGENFNEYVALNLLEELDEPGEWYVDREKGLLFFWPPGEIANARVAVSVLEEPLVALDHASNVIFRSLTIENGRGIGISMEGGEHDSIVGCVVRNVGTVGIMMGKGAEPSSPGAVADDYRGVPVSRVVGSLSSECYVNTVWDRDAGKDQAIDRCEIYNTGSGGIVLGGGSKKELTPGRCAVTNCRIHDYDRRNKAGACGVIVDGCGNIVAHNEIYNGDLQAIMVHGNDHLFEFNLIHDVARNSNDASAWYLGRDPSDQGNIVRWNFFHHVGRPDRKWTMGVYCDDATCGVLIEGNVFYKVASYGTVYSNGGHDIVVRNNIFVAGYGPAIQVKSMWYDFGIGEIPYFFGEKGIYTKRLTASVDIRKPPYSTRYPLLKDWLDLLPDGKTYTGMRPRRNVFDLNVLYKYDETFRLVGKYAQCDFGENFIAQTDPGFVEAGKMNFALKDDSQVYRELPGFKKIPFDLIGPKDR